MKFFSLLLSCSLKYPSMIKLAARFLIIVSVIFTCCSKDEKPLTFTPIDLEEFSSKLKGFNLTGKVDVNWSNGGFREEEFEIIRDLGFNFARLPLDYRTYTETGNWDVFLEEEIA